MFKIQEQGKPETAIWLNQLETLLSTDGSPDIKLNKSFMQEKVCSVKILTDNEKLYLSDLTFNEDILVNDNKIATGSRVELHHGDILNIGGNLFEIFNPSIALKRLSNQDTADVVWKLVAVSNWLEGQSFDIKGKAVLGRDKDCDITIPGSHLSRRHAEIFVTGDALLIRDLGSANGSFINGQAFSEAKVRDGDELRFDQLTFKVEAPQSYAAIFDAQFKTLNNEPTPEQVPDDATQFSPALAADKQWKTKPTSIGNQITDADIRLQDHQKHKRITYLFFSSAITLAIIGTVAWQYLH